MHSKMQKTSHFEYSLMILAAGRGMRLTGGLSSKAMFPIAGRPLISFIMECRKLPCITSTAVLIRPDDLSLKTYLEGESSRSARGIDIIAQPCSCTAEATSMLYEVTQAEHHVWATCDEICTAGDVAALVEYYEIKHGDGSAMSVIPVTPIIGEDKPVWVDVAEDMSVRGLGKQIPATELAWGNMRISGPEFRTLHFEHCKNTNQETRVYDSIIRSTVGKHFAIIMPGIFDVDTPQERPQHIISLSTDN